MPEEHGPLQWSCTEVFLQGKWLFQQWAYRLPHWVQPFLQVSTKTDKGVLHSERQASVASGSVLRASVKLSSVPAKKLWSQQGQQEIILSHKSRWRDCTFSHDPGQNIGPSRSSFPEAATVWGCRGTQIHQYSLLVALAKICNSLDSTSHWSLQNPISSRCFICALNGWNLSLSSERLIHYLILAHCSETLFSNLNSGICWCFASSCIHRGRQDIKMHPSRHMMYCW